MSLISTEPQSRTALDGHSNNLTTQFDTQLEIIVDRYLSFFQERRSIEETYVDSLRNLHLKAYVTDTSFDPRVEPTTTRAAWNKVRGNLERESKSRQAFVDTLDVDILKPLTALKESLAQARKWLKEELKKSAEDYANHAENTLSKLGRVYLKKYQDYVRPVETPRRTLDPSNKSIGSRFSSLFRGRREAEGAESDVAEPEEVVSDEDCRKAVQTLNLLRLRRVEILEDGYETLERIYLTTTIKDLLVKYVEGMISSCGKHTYLAISTRSEVEKALVTPDTHDLAASFRRALAFSLPPITFYRNFRVGGRSDAVFGITLVDYATSRDREGRVPKIIGICIEDVEKRGLNINKIYATGSMDCVEVQRLRQRFEQNEKAFSFSHTDDIHSIAMLLKLYLRELPEPLFRLSLHDYRQYRQNKAIFIENDFSLLRAKINELPPVHKASLWALTQHLSLVASHADKNGMGAQDLASVLALYVFGRGEMMQSNVDVRKLARVSLMEILIKNAPALFNDYDLPPTPPSSTQASETTSVISYGSLFLSPDFTPYSDVQSMGSIRQSRPRPVSQIYTSAQSTSSISPPDSTVDLMGSHTPTLVPLLSPLPGFSHSWGSTDTKEVSPREQVRSNTRSRAFTNSSQDSVPTPPNSAHSRRMPQPAPYLEALSLSLSPGAGSAPSDSTDNPLSSATSLQSALGAYSPPPEETLR